MPKLQFTLNKRAASSRKYLVVSNRVRSTSFILTTIELQMAILLMSQWVQAMPVGEMPQTPGQKQASHFFEMIAHQSKIIPNPTL